MLAAQGAIGVAVVALVAEGRARVDIGTEADENLEMRRIAFFSAGEVECDDVAVVIGLQMDFGREPATRAAERLGRLPPFAPAAET